MSVYEAFKPLFEVVGSFVVAGLILWGLYILWEEFKRWITKKLEQRVDGLEYRLEAMCDELNRRGKKRNKA